YSARRRDRHGHGQLRGGLQGNRAGVEVMITREQLADLRKDAEFTRDRVGAPGSAVRERAKALLEVLDLYECWTGSVRQRLEAIEHALEDILAMQGGPGGKDPVGCVGEGRLQVALEAVAGAQGMFDSVDENEDGEADPDGNAQEAEEDRADAHAAMVRNLQAGVGLKPGETIESAIDKMRGPDHGVVEEIRQWKERQAAEQSAAEILAKEKIL
ncbi:MAG: hypothetical protein ACRD3I_02200, partial [Terriglobales bacterium]